MQSVCPDLAWFFPHRIDGTIRYATNGGDVGGWGGTFFKGAGVPFIEVLMTAIEEAANAKAKAKAKEKEGEGSDEAKGSASAADAGGSAAVLTPCVADLDIVKYPPFESVSIEVCHRIIHREIPRFEMCLRTLVLW